MILRNSSTDNIPITPSAGAAELKLLLKHLESNIFHKKSQPHNAPNLKVVLDPLVMRTYDFRSTELINRSKYS